MRSVVQRTFLGVVSPKRLELFSLFFRITVRAPYPERFMSVLTGEVKWLAKHISPSLNLWLVMGGNPLGVFGPQSGKRSRAELCEHKFRKPEWFAFLNEIHIPRAIGLYCQ
jgi:hypothetical protein